MSEQRDVNELLREGIEAARGGDKTAARALFEQVVELDENNERGWYWLASVVETDEERRVCLGNVLVINPNNEKARKLMDKLEAKKREQEAEEEVIPGISRRQLTLIVGVGGGVVVLLALIVIALVVASNNARNAEIAAQTRIAQEITNTVEAGIVRQTQVAETQAAIATFTPTLRAVSPLPPTFTPTATEPPVEGEVALPPPPNTITGTLAAWGGRDVLGQSDQALPILTINLPTLAQTQVGEEYGRETRFADNPGRVIYTRYFAPTFSYGVEEVNVNGTQSTVIQDNPTAYRLSEPDRCPADNRVTFTAIAQREVDVGNLQLDQPPTQVFISDGQSITAITNDTATYTDPSFSPDCSRIAAVRNDINSTNPGPDIVVIEVASGSFRPITTDFTTFAERTPRWSPDGTQVIFAAAPATDPSNHDIFVINADGTGVPLSPTRSPADEILPVYSPDGQYIAFTSNRGAEGSAYNIFIYSLADSQLYQVTNSVQEGNFYVGDWWQ